MTWNLKWHEISNDLKSQRSWNVKCHEMSNDVGSMTPSRNTRRYTLRSVPSSPGRSFLVDCRMCKVRNLFTLHYKIWRCHIFQFFQITHNGCNVFSCPCIGQDICTIWPFVCLTETNHLSKLKWIIYLNRNRGPEIMTSPPFASLHGFSVASRKTQIEEEVLLYPFTSFVAEFGGALGLFLGFSFMTILQEIRGCFGKWSWYYLED